MSIPSDEAEEHNRAPRVLVLLRALAACSACVAIAALWSVERTEVAHDLQLAAPSHARPGEQIALRALLFRDVDAAEGPTLVRAEARVRLLDAAGRELARTALTASALTTLDGALSLPTSRTGPHVLEADARVDGSLLRCRHAIEIATDAPSEPLSGREAGALQQLSVGRVRALHSGAPPDPMLPRVLGSACVPETPCRMAVWVGTPAASIAVRPGVGVALLAPPSSAETEGLVAFTVRVEGLDAQLTLEARRGGVPVAERSVRLPVGLGEVRIEPRASLVGAPIPLVLTAPPGRAQVVLDNFVAGRWHATRVIDVGEQGGSARVDIDPAALPPGMLRLQARTDRFGSEGASARVVYLRGPGEEEPAALTEIARRLADEPALRGEPTRAWGKGLPLFATTDRALAAAFLLAPLEQLRAATPLAVGDRAARVAQLARIKLRIRVGVATSLVLSALAVGFSIARRGMSAVAEAEAILAEGRAASDRTSRFEGMRGRVTVLLLVLAVASAFLAGALLIVAKPLWF